MLLTPNDALAIDQRATDTSAIGDQRYYRYTVPWLDEGEVYLFQVAAVNARGQNGLSAAVAIPCAVRPGVALYGDGATDSNTTAHYALVKPVITDVTATSVSS